MEPYGALMEADTADSCMKKCDGLTRAREEPGGPAPYASNWVHREYRALGGPFKGI